MLDCTLRVQVGSAMRVQTRVKWQMLIMTVALTSCPVRQLHCMCGQCVQTLKNAGANANPCSTAPPHYVVV